MSTMEAIELSQCQDRTAGQFNPGCIINILHVILLKISVTHTFIANLRVSESLQKHLLRMQHPRIILPFIYADQVFLTVQDHHGLRYALWGFAPPRL